MTKGTIPWATAATGAAAVVVWLWPGAEAGLIYDRVAVGTGQWWRLFTGHFVHFDGAHLGWNLAVLAGAGAWLERLEPRRARGLLAAGPAVISAALLLQSDLARYAGLSGIAAGLVAALAVRQLRTPGESRWIWGAVLGLLGLKIGLEAGTATPLLGGGFRPVPLAHLAGALWGAGVIAWRLPRAT